MSSEILRVVVALDPAAPSEAMMEAVSSWVRGRQAELLGLFVEDHNLERLAGLSAAREVRTTGGEPAPLDPQEMVRQVREQGERVRRAFESGVSKLRLAGSFSIARGDVCDEMSKACEAADLLVVGRAQLRAGVRSWQGMTLHRLVSRVPRTLVFVQEQWRTGRTLVAICEDGEADRGLIRLAAQIAEAEGLELLLLATSEIDVRKLTAQIAAVTGDSATDVGIRVRILRTDRDVATWARVARHEEARALFLSSSQVGLEEKVARLLTATEASLVLVPPSSEG